MSVSTTTVSVSISSSADTTQVNSNPAAQASAAVSTAASYHSHGGGSVNFHASQSQGGPVFGQQQPAASHHNYFNSPAHSQDFSAMTHHASHHGGTQQLEQWGNPWMGRPKPLINAHGPYPITLGKTDPMYSKKSNDQLATDLLRNARAFTTPGNRSTISKHAIEEMAQQKPGRNPVMNQNIRLAGELMKRPDVMDAFFRQPGTGATGDQVSISHFSAFNRDQNPLKYSTNKQVVQELNSHFGQLSEYFGGRQINILDLEYLAGLQQTGISSLDHLLNVSKTATDRKDLLDMLDNVASRSADNRISQTGLMLASYMMA
ncbi:hypothetical protein SAMN04490179_4686 [Pseudomonas antarctica]|uniref:Uncharacterized protein n=1 Tax=Pseudomonas antarctica TaxID=219572 RepID=A0A1H0C6S7_9PSED|nr:hypothetical protein [Pseudomonas antarctica]KAF2406847.1 hypothetical protein PSAN_50250 [Pseudomonas antarctica]SDN53558.1 hypothetical protein SAMN04490179_4686 [Pseudomonas antarctica]